MSVVRNELFLIACTETDLDSVYKDMQIHTG